MVKRMTASQAKATFLRLLDEVSDGGEVEITRHGRLVARLGPPPGPLSLEGSAVGIAVTSAPDEALFSTDDSWELF